MKTLKFPDDFTSEQHRFGGIHYKYSLFNELKISIVFGRSFYSNGIDTYEMWDYREGDPQGYLSIEQINEHLKNNPF